MKANISRNEETAAAEICQLAEALQDLLYCREAEGHEISRQTRLIFDGAYRNLKRAVLYYYEGDSPLHYDPKPGTPFRKKP